jgi:hypothetical protein
VIFTSVLVIAAIFAIVASESVNLIASLAALAAFGFTFSVAFALLGAFEVSALQLVIEVFLLALIMSWTRTSYAKERYKGRELFAYICALLFCVLLLAAFNAVFRAVPFSASFTKDLVSHVQGTRGLDVIAAATAIFTAAMGVTAVLKQTNKGEKK